MHNLHRLLPPGADRKQELLGCLLLLFAEFGISLSYPVVLFSNLRRLYCIKGGKRYLWEDAMMPTVNELLHGKLCGFPVLLCGCIVLAIAHYAAFYRESRSIYVMKRLEDPREMHRRCLALPLLCLFSGIVLLLILLAVYILLYYRLTPPQCLPPTIPFHFWRCFV